MLSVDFKEENLTVPITEERDDLMKKINRRISFVLIVSLLSALFSVSVSFADESPTDEQSAQIVVPCYENTNVPDLAWFIAMDSYETTTEGDYSVITYKCKSIDASSGIREYDKYLMETGWVKYNIPNFGSSSLRHGIYTNGTFKIKFFLSGRVNGYFTAVIKVADISQYTPDDINENLEKIKTLYNNDQIDDALAEAENIYNNMTPSFIDIEKLNVITRDISAAKKGNSPAEELRSCAQGFYDKKYYRISEFIAAMDINFFNCSPSLRSKIETLASDSRSKLTAMTAEEQLKEYRDCDDFLSFLSVMTSTYMSKNSFVLQNPEKNVTEWEQNPDFVAFEKATNEVEKNASSMVDLYESYLTLRASGNNPIDYYRFN